MRNLSALSPSSTVKRNDVHLIASELGDDMVMMDIHNGLYISLNSTGRKIWEMIENPVRLSVLVEKLSVKYNVDYDTCYNETIAFLENLYEKKALDIAD
ncbi:MAG: PqqD family peptide modification chaperone [Bacteroidales bacterium]|jgi:hypothetical protein|nr:PqqD family peptide modification chaperone [Bacteroidales bacterium]